MNNAFYLKMFKIFISNHMPDFRDLNKNKSSNDALKISGFMSLPKGLVSKIGYGLILFSLFDFLTIVYPPQFTNPFWEFNFVQATVERIVVPLIGFTFIFMVGPANRSKYERLSLRVISWCALLIFLLCIPMTALTLSSVVRIDRQNNQQLIRQKNQSLSELQAVQEELKNTSNVEQLSGLLNQLQIEDRPIRIEATDYDAVKEELSTNLARQFKEIRSIESRTRSEQRKTLLKGAVRVLIGLLLTAVLFLSVWKETKWARTSIPYFVGLEEQAASESSQMEG